MIYPKNNELQNLITAPQNLTDAWVDLGQAIFSGNKEKIGLWINLDINNSTGVQLRAKASDTTAFTDAYVLPIKTVTATKISLDEEVYEFTAVDQKILLNIDVDGLVPYVKFQVKATVVGVTAGQIDGAKVSFKY
jgi:3D (Asp-Asp-Asp) domain-containing protein